MLALDSDENSARYVLDKIPYFNNVNNNDDKNDEDNNDDDS